MVSTDAAVTGHGRCRRRLFSSPRPHVIIRCGCRAAMSPAVRVGNPRGPGPGAAVVAEEEEEAAAVAWRELRGKAAEFAAAAEERVTLARRIEAALQVRPCHARKWLEPIAPFCHDVV